MEAKVYATQACPWCVRLASSVPQVDFEEANVAKDEAAAKDMVENTGQMGMPAVKVDGKFIVGFDEAALRAVLGIGA